MVFVVSDNDQGESFELSVNLPTVNVISLPVYVELSLPTEVSVESPLSLIYTLQNNTDNLHDIDVTVESSEAFMFAGHRQVSILTLNCLLAGWSDLFLWMNFLLITILP